jgi:CheY-like chemotaxis protein
MAIKKILIVDDSAVVLKAFQARLRAEGFEVATADDPSSALAAAREFGPDLVIMDINFPPDVGTVSWDGIKLIHWLRVSGATGKVPAIVITSDNADIHRERALAAGATAVFQKPVKVSELLGAIRNCNSPAPQLV